MIRKRYVNIALPKELVEILDKVMKNSGLGFKSRAEIVKTALIDIMDKARKLEQWVMIEKRRGEDQNE